mmetsp:Transcript_122394/g.280450  ORF Transcript_122394/g.280450 Transcript_122394/m.280450 type:complete len:233 (+) Transcript_122394:796-1494(+)
MRKKTLEVPLVTTFLSTRVPSTTYTHSGLWTSTHEPWRAASASRTHSSPWLGVDFTVHGLAFFSAALTFAGTLVVVDGRCTDPSEKTCADGKWIPIGESSSTSAHWAGSTMRLMAHVSSATPVGSPLLPSLDLASLWSAPLENSMLSAVLAAAESLSTVWFLVHSWMWPHAPHASVVLSRPQRLGAEYPGRTAVTLRTAEAPFRRAGTGLLAVRGRAAPVAISPVAAVHSRQ